TGPGRDPGERGEPRLDHVPRRQLGSLPRGEPGGLCRVPRQPVPVRAPRPPGGGRGCDRLPAVAAGVLGHRRQHRGRRGPGLPERAPVPPPLTARRDGAPPGRRARPGCPAGAAPPPPRPARPPPPPPPPRPPPHAAPP